MYLFLYENQYFLTFFTENKGNDIEKVKILAFLFSISDIFILDSNLNLPEYSYLLYFASTRLEGTNLYKSRVDVYQKPFSNKKIDENIFEFDYFITKFSDDEKEVSDQMSFLMKNYLNINSR